MCKLKTWQRNRWNLVMWIFNVCISTGRNWGIQLFIKYSCRESTLELPPCFCELILGALKMIYFIEHHKFVAIQSKHLFISIDPDLLAIFIPFSELPSSWNDLKYPIKSTFICESVKIYGCVRYLPTRTARILFRLLHIHQLPWCHSGSNAIKYISSKNFFSFFQMIVVIVLYYCYYPHHRDDDDDYYYCCCFWAIRSIKAVRAPASLSFSSGYISISVALPIEEIAVVTTIWLQHSPYGTPL